MTFECMDKECRDQVRIESEGNKSALFPLAPRSPRDAFGDALALVVAANTCTSTTSNESSNDLKLRRIAKFLFLPWLTSNFVSPQLQSPWSYSAPSGVVREGTASKLADDVSMAPQLHYGMPAKAHRGSSLSASGGYLQLSLISLTPRPISHQLMLLLEAPRA